MRPLLIALLLIATPAFAKDNAIVVNGGWEHTANSNYSDGVTGSVRYERILLGDFWIAAEYTYHGPMEHHNGNDDQPESYGDVSGHSLLADLVYYPEVEIWKISPYFIAGAGWSKWDFEPSETTKASGVQVDLGSAFCYKLGAGLNYDLGAGWSFNTEWSFFKADIPKNATNADGSPSALLGDDQASGRVRIGEEETRLVCGLRYEF